MPEDVVGYEEPALAQTRHGQAKDPGILFFVHIVEDDVEGGILLLRKNFECIASVDLNSVGDAGLLEIAACFFCVLLAAVGVDHATTVAHSARPPDGGISDSRTHLENCLRIDAPRQQEQ